MPTADEACSFHNIPLVETVSRRQLPNLLVPHGLKPNIPLFQNWAPCPKILFPLRHSGSNCCPTFLHPEDFEHVAWHYRRRFGGDGAASRQSEYGNERRTGAHAVSYCIAGRRHPVLIYRYGQLKSIKRSLA